MIRIKVSLRDHPYSIMIGRRVSLKIADELKKLAIGRDGIIVTSAPIKRLHASTIISGLKKNGFTVKLIEVPDGEQSKSIQMAHQVLEDIARYDVMKKVFIVALGGGVVGDLAGYVAAVYKRGIPYVQVPTTLLAQIDSAIGGKVAVDLPVGKNLVGAFYQPKMVFSDVQFLSTLSMRQIRNGLAEAVKYGVICDRALFDLIEDRHDEILKLSPELLTDVVVRCSRIKADIVERDEKETKGLRTILNFGHTIGHAIEAAGGFRLYQHGEAIALGMRVAASVSHKVLRFSSEDVTRINILLTKIGLPERISGIRLSDILSLMKHDKKFSAGQNRFVLAKRIGQVKVVEGIKWEEIEDAIREVM